MIVVSELSVEAPKTKMMDSQLKELGISQALIVLDQPDENIYLAARNLPTVEVCDVQEVNPVNLIAYEKVVISSAAVKKLEARLS